MSKPITATALMMLVDEGKVNVDDPVEKYLPEFHGQMLAVEQDENHAVLKKPSHPILVRDILSHTSGLPFARASSITSTSARCARRPSATRSRPCVRSRTASTTTPTPASTPPGGSSRSSAACRTSSFCRRGSSIPLGMKDTTFFPKGEQLTRLAKSYRPIKPNPAWKKSRSTR